LPQDAWQRRQDLAFESELHAADCEVCTGALQAAEQRLAALATRTVDNVQRCIVAQRRVDLYVILGAAERVVAVALECLRHVGIDWSAHPAEVDARHEYERIWSLLGNRRIEDLVDLPLIRDPEARATLDLLTSLVLPALYTDPNLFALSACMAVNLSLEHGNSEGSLLNYVATAMVAGPRFGHYDEGYRFGKLACDLLERRGLTYFGARTYTAFAIVVPWTRPLREGIEPSRRAFQMAKENGDPAYAAFASRGLSTILLALGHPLDQFEREGQDALEFVQQYGFFLDRLSAPIALARTLRGRTTKFGSLDDGGFTERSFEERITGQPSRVFLESFYWIRKLQARFFAGDYASAFEAAEKVEAWYATAPALALFPLEKAECHFYAGLCRAARCEPVGPDPCAKHREALGAHERHLRAWAANYPENFEDRAALVGAEIARIEGRPLDAMDLYERAIASARANGFVHNEALAYELAARFYAARGFEEVAHLYLGNARRCYLRWGADGKVRQLDQLHPRLRPDERAPGPTGTIEAPVEQLDLATVIEVSQAISGEIVLEKLIDRVIRAAIEHAGAERGLLISPRGEELQIDAEATTRGEDAIVQLREGAHPAGALPEALVRYTMRTQETVILDDASSQNPFSTDPYIIQHRPRSILCLPLINQGKIIGILYLENNLTSRVFTPERVLVLKVLASQAAISLENTRLYRDLEDREAKIRRLVDANIIGIFVGDLQGRILEANDAFLRILGYDREDLVSGRVSWTEMTPPEWRERNVHTIGELSSTGTTQVFEKEYFRKDGTRVPVLIGATLFKEGGNEGVAFVLDLTERKRAEEEHERLRQLESDLTHVNRLSIMGELAASLAHEILHPIATARNNARAGMRFLEMSPPNLDEVGDALGCIVRDADRAKDIVGRMRDHVKKAPPRRESFDLNEAVSEVIVMVRSAIAKNGIAVSTHFMDGLVPVQGDRVQLQQVAMNLILNAVEAMGSVEAGDRDLLISTAQDHTGVRVAVRDSGPGIDPTHLERVFEAFYTTKSSGMGMGLSVCRSIVDAHGGRLWAEANEPRGAVFQFTLPATQEES
jgi:PAS domain S-box-containing protein